MPEQIVNGGFENDFTGWTQISSDIDTTIYYNGGTKSCHQQYSAFIQQMLSSPLNPSNISTFTCYVKKGDDNGASILFIEFITDEMSKSVLILSGDGSTPPIDWTQIDLLSAFNSSGVTGNLIGIVFYRPDDNFVDYWIDDVSLIGGSSTNTLSYFIDCKIELMGVYINSIKLNHIYGFEKMDSQIAQLPEFINDPDLLVLPDFYNRMIIKVEYHFRATDAEKWIFDQILKSHTLVTLTDSIHNLKGNVWVADLDESWKGNYNVERPWEIKITVYSEVLNPNDC